MVPVGQSPNDRLQFQQVHEFPTDQRGVELSVLRSLGYIRQGQPRVQRLRGRDHTEPIAAVALGLVTALALGEIDPVQWHGPSVFGDFSADIIRPGGDAGQTRLGLAREQLGVPTWKQETLVKAAGEADGLTRHLLGRKPSIDETAALAATPERDRLALLLASPEFQLY